MKKKKSLYKLIKRELKELFEGKYEKE